MEAWVIALIIAAAVIIVALLAWIWLQQRRRGQLRSSFGPEYDRLVDQYGDRKRAEKELSERKTRVERLAIKPLSPADRDRYADAWRATQARFVDNPDSAIEEADKLIGEVMRARGYPVGDFESRAADLSVEHGKLVTNYRSAHAIAERNRERQASTEDLRQALVHYRSLFDDLLETPQAAQQEARR